MLNHFLGTVSTEQTEPKLFDLAFETGHNEAFPAPVPQLPYASAELVCTLELGGTTPPLPCSPLHLHPSKCFLFLKAQFEAFFSQATFLG